MKSSILDELLADCNNQYLSLISFMEMLLEQIGTLDPVLIRERLQELDKLQAEASRRDNLLKSHITKTGQTNLQGDFLNLRQKLLQQLTDLNDLLVQKLEGKMSVMAHELNQTRRNRQALGSYKPYGKTSRFFRQTT